MTTGTTLDAAIEQLHRGRYVIDVPRGRKGVVRAGWQHERLTVQDAPKRFGDGQNAGLLCGEASKVVDVDLDCGEALSVADFFLPSTNMVHGRPSKQRSHRWYRPAPIPETRQFKDITGAMLVELRSTGAQTLIPPSVHPSGESFAWDVDGDPAEVDAVGLQAVVAKVAAAALVARHWPARGGRHEASKALAGFLLRGGWTEDQTMVFVEAVVAAAHDEDGRARLSDVRTTVRALAAGRKVTGGPTLVELLPDGPKVVSRLSDWLGLRSPRALLSEPGYTVESGRLCRIKQTKDGAIVEPLGNFTARVDEEIVLDDGAETTRAFIIRGALATGQPLPPARVPASMFAGMSWVTAQWGLRAVVRAGLSTKDYLREAIQRLSPDAPQRHVFTHCGWREIGGEWLYLTGGGAVGRAGFEVDLGPELARYRLPSVPADPVGAMRASLRLLSVAPLTVSGPLWAGAFRAPLAAAFPVDLALWIEGQTGNLKSTLAALFLGHYGDFDRTHLPAAWSSTANQLERRAFILKDTMMVVDDYAPSALDARELEGKAARLIRAQGNLAGRGRLRADLTERPGFPPRGLIVSTGEQHPPGRSLLARTLLIEPRRSEINMQALSEAQRDAGRLAHAMSAYVLWLAPQMPVLPAMLRETFEGARARVAETAAHLRVPEAIAHLWLGLHCGMTFAVEIGACSAGEAEDLEMRCSSAFLELAGAQGRLLEDERPTLRFLRVLLTLVSQGRAALPSRDSEDGARLGVDLVGWQDDDALYLNPEAAHHAVSRYCRDAGEPFPIRRERLQKDLLLDGLSEVEDGRHTKTTRAGGRTRRVLWIKRPAIVALLGEDFPRPSPPVTGFTGPTE